MLNFKEIETTPPATQEKKMTLNLKQVMTAPPAASKPKPPPVQAKPVIKKIVKKKPEAKQAVVKQKLLDISTKTFAEKSTEDTNLSKITPKKKMVKKKLKKKPVKKVVKKRTKPKKIKRVKKVRRSKDPLANFLRGSTKKFKYSKNKQRQRKSSSGAYGDRMIHNLYGPEFNTYTKTQKKFIRNNLGTIHRITQNTLTRNGYPSVAVRTQQQGTNVVSFYLHPNGDISGLRLKTPIGYAALDQNTLDVIRIAYKDYPLPNKKTRIIFYVSYRLY